MSSEATLVRVASLTKHFHLYRRPLDRLVDLLGGGATGRARTFAALDDVSFDVPPGTALGIVGPNGSGKTTLLRILAGTLAPTAGRVEIDGRVAALFELGIGFHPDFTGRQNIAVNARILGLSDAEVAARLPDILAFAELGEFIDQPLRVYSSGMQLRLGFAVAVNVQADVLLIDEALAVGDAYFQQKCLRQLRALRDRGVTTVLVSHDAAAVKSLCSTALLLHAGRVLAHGEAATVLERYNALIAAQTQAGLTALEAQRDAPHARAYRFGRPEASITAIELLDQHGAATRAVLPGDEVEIRVQVQFAAALEQPTVGILIRDRLGNDVYGTNTFLQDIDTGRYEPGHMTTFSFFLQLDLGPGDYTLTAAVHSLDVHVHECYDWVDRYLAFQMLRPSDRRSIGTAYLRPRIAVGGRRLQ